MKKYNFRQELENADIAVNKLIAMIDVLQNASTGVNEISEDTIEMYMIVMQEIAEPIKAGIDTALNARKEK